LPVTAFEWTSDRFRQLVGMVEIPPSLGDAVLKRLSSDDQLWVRERIRRHILNAIFKGALWAARLVALALATRVVNRFR
jgi:hypothetical protein